MNSATHAPLTQHLGPIPPGWFQLILWWNTPINPHKINIPILPNGWRDHLSIHAVHFGVIDTREEGNAGVRLPDGCQCSMKPRRLGAPLAFITGASPACQSYQERTFAIYRAQCTFSRYCYICLGQSLGSICLVFSCQWRASEVSQYLALSPVCVGGRVKLCFCHCVWYIVLFITL